MVVRDSDYRSRVMREFRGAWPAISEISGPMQAGTGLALRCRRYAWPCGIRSWCTDFFDLGLAAIPQWWAGAQQPPKLSSGTTSRTQMRKGP
jgi:hypothetical protein